ncbi:Fructosamine kinase [Corynebacterium occultum]|uniref:Fructosamine kinase n=1 Tax=Corynebacterium occultum TaxID=2675219 RepID=A0A6B8WA75_9CORY|nr:fructosamine kinase family protein [Corynebacterium occultum]QGU08175.1 Fructosamine kinase [Corynebacterium occultum]
MVETFRKCPAEPHSAEAEAAGLRWLREASEAVARVHAVTGNCLETINIHTVRPSPEAARRAGRELALIHRAGAPAFGSPPAGWEGPNYIGTQRQECTPTAHWGQFYAQQRVLPFARAAQRRGNLSPAGLELVERAATSISTGEWDITPARIHGDLWAGNLLFGEQGPVFIDPAAHGGHPQTDLAMLDLFGAPHLAEIRAGYQEITALPAGWLEFTAVHQLHPLAVHTLTHGAGYAPALMNAARKTLELLPG